MNEARDYKMGNMAVLSAALVVFIHISGPKIVGGIDWWFHYIIRSVFASIAVPYFFVASGFFLSKHINENGWYIRESKKRVRTLLVPYLIWCAIWVVYNYVLGVMGDCVQGVAVDFSISSFLDWSTFGIDLFQAPSCFPLWFIRMLLILFAVSPICVWLVRKFDMAFLLLLVIINLTWLYFKTHLSGSWQGFLYYGLSLEGLLYFTVGLSLRGNIRLPKWRGAACVVVGLAIGLISGILLGKGFVSQVSQCVAFVGTMFTLTGIFSIMSSRKMPQVIYTLTFPIYVIHLFPILFISIAFPSTERTIARMCLDYLFALVASAFVVMAIRRLVPRFNQIAFGGRGA